MGWSKLVDLELSDDDKIDQANLVSPFEKSTHYPYGLTICLTGVELAKLGLEADCDVGDYLDIRAFATVTAVHKEDGENGTRVTLQIEKMAVEQELEESSSDG